MWRFSILLLSLAIIGCSSSLESKSENNGNFSKIDNDVYMLAQLSDHKHEWRNVPYSIGGMTKQGIDCSGFVKLTFEQRFNVTLPRTTVAQSQQGKKIAKQELQTGDLVFFKTGRGPNGYHVGIYTENGKFLHASTSRGVITSSLNSTYWKKRFWQARRVA